MPGLGTALGRGAATSLQEDLQNSDCILIMGSNMAEAHPVGFRFPMMARERGAQLIHVDPHFSRTSAMCNQYVPIRTGTDIAFLGGVINYILTNDRWFREYVMAYTNAATIINDEYKDAEDQGGFFDGYDLKSRSYDPSKIKWNYASDKEQPKSHGQTEVKSESFSERAGAISTHKAESDPTLENPRCVLNILRHHYERYTPEMVEQVCGCTKEQFLKVAETLCANSGR
ncbi:MAG: molybdopterin-dependent oxidoreductase, partial [Candidatus Sulfotelmatobacter sp.]